MRRGGPFLRSVEDQAFTDSEASMTQHVASPKSWLKIVVLPQFHMALRLLSSTERAQGPKLSSRLTKDYSVSNFSQQCQPSRQYGEVLTGRLSSVNWTHHDIGEIIGHFELHRHSTEVNQIYLSIIQASDKTKNDRKPQGASKG